MDPTRPQDDMLRILAAQTDSSTMELPRTAEAPRRAARRRGHLDEQYRDTLAKAELEAGLREVTRPALVLTPESQKRFQQRTQYLEAQRIFRASSPANGVARHALSTERCASPLDTYRAHRAEQKRRCAAALAALAKQPDERRESLDGGPNPFSEQEQETMRMLDRIISEEQGR